MYANWGKHHRLSTRGAGLCTLQDSHLILGPFSIDFEEVASTVLKMETLEPESLGPNPYLTIFMGNFQDVCALIILSINLGLKSVAYFQVMVSELTHTTFLK